MPLNRWRWAGVPRDGLRRGGRRGRSRSRGRSEEDRTRRDGEKSFFFIRHSTLYLSLVAISGLGAGISPWCCCRCCWRVFVLLLLTFSCERRSRLLQQLVEFSSATHLLCWFALASSPRAATASHAPVSTDAAVLCSSNLVGGARRSRSQLCDGSRDLLPSSRSIFCVDTSALHWRREV